MTTIDVYVFSIWICIWFQPYTATLAKGPVAILEWSPQNSDFSTDPTIISMSILISRISAVVQILIIILWKIWSCVFSKHSNFSNHSCCRSLYKIGMRNCFLFTKGETRDTQICRESYDLIGSYGHSSQSETLSQPFKHNSNHYPKQVGLRHNTPSRLDQVIVHTISNQMNPNRPACLLSLRPN